MWPTVRKIALLLSFMLSAVSGHALELEDQVKAAFLLNFAKFVQWPAEKFEGPQSPLRLCVFGSASRAEIFAQVIAGESVNERLLEVSTPSQAGVRNCHIAFVSYANDDRTLRDLESLTGTNTLTVYETREPLAAGVIRFFLKDRKLRFEISTRAAGLESLTLSSKLLRVASIRSD